MAGTEDKRPRESPVKPAGGGVGPSILKDHISTIVAGSALGLVIAGIVVLGIMGQQDSTLHDVAIGLTGVLGGVSMNKAMR